MKTLAMTSAAVIALAASACAQDTTTETEDLLTEDRSVTTQDQPITGDSAVPEEYSDTEEYSQTYGEWDMQGEGSTLERSAALTEADDEFELADADRDGELSQEEFVAAMAPPAPMGQGDTDPAMAEAGEPAESQAGLPTASEYLVAKFQTISGDDDMVTAEELKDARGQDFDEADANGDDVLEGDELTSYAALKNGKTAN